jgi:hypothetical protein
MRLNGAIIQKPLILLLTAVRIGYLTAESSSIHTLRFYKLHLNFTITSTCRSSKYLNVFYSVSYLNPSPISRVDYEDAVFCVFSAPVFYGIACYCFADHLLTLVGYPKRNLKNWSKKRSTGLPALLKGSASWYTEERDLNKILSFELYLRRIERFTRFDHIVIKI